MTQSTSESVAVPSAIRHDLKRWPIVAAAGLVLLLGRYDWSAGRRGYSTEAYLASAWMLMLLLPGVFYTAQILCGRAVARGAAGVVWLACVLPYRWLGFAGSGFWSDRFVYADWIKETNPPLPQITWFPAALREEPVIPHELLVFGLLIGCAAAVLIFLSSRGGITRQTTAVGFVAMTLIVSQSWLHLSLRAPYTYLMHYAEPKATQKAWITYDANGHPTIHIDQVPKPHGWWHIYLFPNYRGAVTYDYPLFRACEEIFQGVPPDQSTPIARRILTFYISSQFVCFFNPYYVFMFFNTACWLLATLAGFALMRRLSNERVAMVFALFIATGSGFIFFANQPTSYISGYAAVMIVCYFFERLLVEEITAEAGWLFGLIFGLAMLTSDLTPLIPFFPFYASARNVRMKRALLPVIFGLCVYGTSLAFLADVAHVPNLLGNFEFLASPTGQLNSINKIYITTLQFLNRFAMDLLHAFLILPLLPAVVGIAFLREKKLGLAVIAFILPAVGAIGVLEFTDAQMQEWPLAALPRLAYIAYPGIYFLAALGLVEGSAILLGRWPRVARVAPYCFILLVLAINNIDVFGVPATYYHFYFGLNSSGFMPFGEPH